jgi:hypothetical protein
MSRNPLIITLAIAAMIVVAALATLGVLTALAGQQSGLEKSGRNTCPTLGAKAFRDVSNPGYGRRLATLARCSH